MVVPKASPPDSGSTPTAEVIAVLPARYASQRFPGKPLADLCGKPLLAWAIAAALRAERVGAVLVATDHAEIARIAEDAGAEVSMTSADHRTGSDRIGEAVQGRSESVVLNVQGDEPLVPPAAIDALVDLLDHHPGAAVSTLAAPCSEADVESPHVVKVVRDPAGRALYFSRSPIPGRHPHGTEAVSYLRHVGLYGYRRTALDLFLGASPSALERAEGLEQLRLLENGLQIVVGDISELPPGVDTPEDLERCRKRLLMSES